MPTHLHPPSPTALITGGTRGIGRGIALQLATQGFHLALNYARNQQAAEETAAACTQAAHAHGFNPLITLHPADIGSDSDRTALLSEVKSKHSKLHLLINNAGVAPTQRLDLLETTPESLDRLWNINTRGPFLLTQAIARWMIDQIQDEERPSKSSPAPSRQIITISSISAYTASIQRGDYCISKAGLSMLTPLFASRLAAHGIGVFEIRPGIIATDMTAGVKERYDKLIAEGLTPIPRWGVPEDIGRAVLAIAQNHFPFSTGEIFNIDGGFHLRRL